MTLREKMEALCRKAFSLNDNDEVTIIHIIKFANIVAQAAPFCPDTKAEVGEDVYNLCMKVVKVNKRSTNVDVTKMWKLFDESEQAQKE